MSVTQLDPSDRVVVVIILGVTLLWLMLDLASLMLNELVPRWRSCRHCKAVADQRLGECPECFIEHHHVPDPFEEKE